MLPTDEVWLKLAFWTGMNEGMLAEELVALLLERYPKMPENEAWTVVARYRNEHLAGGARD